MKQMMTAKQALDCYLSDANHGSEYVLEHFPDKYSHVFARVTVDKKNKDILFTMKFVKADEDDEMGADAVTVLRACADDMDEELRRHPTYLHSATGIDGYGRLVMMFSHSNMTRDSVKSYMSILGVE